MSAISIAKLYDLLSIKLGKETAENLTTFIDNKINQELESQSNTLATKEDISKLKDDIAKLDTKISESKSENIKWMFIFWVGQMIGMFGFILLFLRK